MVSGPTIPGLGTLETPRRYCVTWMIGSLVSVSCMLLGVLPYVDSTIDLNQVYGERLARHEAASDAQAAGPAESPSPRSGNDSVRGLAS